MQGKQQTRQGSTMTELPENNIKGTICKRLSGIPVSSNMTGLDHSSVTTSGPNSRSRIGLPVNETQQSNILHVVTQKAELMSSQYLQKCLFPTAGKHRSEHFVTSGVLWLDLRRQTAVQRRRA